MVLFLLIDTATEKGIVACGGEGNLLFSGECASLLHQSKYLMPKILEVTGRLLPPLAVGAIGVGVGPGSYTGIRLGVAAAQALAYAWKIPLTPISSLNIFSSQETEGSFAVVFDARMGGIYFQSVEKLPSGAWKRGQSEWVAVEQIGEKIASCAHIVTPHKPQILAKLQQFCSGWKGVVEEAFPSAEVFLASVEERFCQNQKIYPPAPVEIFYLRQTAAEREKSR